MVSNVYGRDTVVGDVVTTLRRRSSGQLAVHALYGPAGSGLTVVADAAASASGLPVVRLGPHREDIADDGAPPAGALLVADDLHVWGPDAVADLTRRLAATGTGSAGRPAALLATVRSPGDGSPGSELLARLDDVTWSQLDPLDDVHVAQIAADRLGGPLPPSALPRVVALCCGSPALAAEIGRLLRAEAADARCCPETVDAACVRAVHIAGLRRLAREIPEAVQVCTLAALIAPEGTPTAAAGLLGWDARSARRAAAVLAGLGLAPLDPAAVRVVRTAAVTWPVAGVSSDLAEIALGYLERVGAGPERLLETMELAGVHDERLLAVSRPCAALALDRGAFEEARRIAEGVLTYATGEDSLSWARGVLFAVAIREDWYGAAQTVRLLPGPPGSAQPPEFGLEAPDAAGPAGDAAQAAGRVDGTGTDTGTDPGTGTDTGTDAADAWATELHRRVVAGQHVGGRALGRALRRGAGHPLHPVEASALALSSLRGDAAEPRLARLRARLTLTPTMLGVSAPFAVYMAAAMLGLADYPLAMEWAALGSMTASTAEQPSLALAHLVSAQAALRLGRHDEARHSADLATGMFAGFGARRLAAVAAATRVHADLEEHRPVAWPDLPDPSRMHPLFGAYLTYVRARHRLADGDLASAASGLFDTGRRLNQNGLRNPTLLNWRPHLSRVFRASGQPRVADRIDADLRRALERWGRLNPAAAARRAPVLLEGPHAAPAAAPQPTPAVVPPSLTRAAAPAAAPATVSGPDGVSAARPDLTGAAGLGALGEHLSEAQARVVRLIVQGKSNAEVARELFLSKRTVDTHLTHVYRRLGIGSRLELVDAVRRGHGTAPAPGAAVGREAGPGSAQRADQGSGAQAGWDTVWVFG